MVESAYIIVSLICIQFLLIGYRYRFHWLTYSRKSNLDNPSISILVAARDEEKHLPDLLRSFENLDYPAEKIQFLFADDQSTDQTNSLIQGWCNPRANASWIITHNREKEGKGNSKAEALAQLSIKATGEYLLFTDADCQVSSQWAVGMVSAFQEKTGMVVGATRVKEPGFLRFFQELDWWNTQGFMKVAADLGMPASGMGNNMAIRRSSYIRCGGFENLPFSMTEDLELTKAVMQTGMSLHSEIHPFTLVNTKSELSLKKLLDQRKRWMAGVVTLPLYWKIILFFQFLYFPASLFLLFQQGVWMIPFLLIKPCIQAICHQFIAGKVGVKLSFFSLLTFDFYFFPATALTILYYFWPTPIKWKYRTYP